MQALWRALTRRKRSDELGLKSELRRVLTLFDLTALGVGSTLGLGAYVLAGSVAYEQAGPAVTVSFLIAAIASAFAGFCYAEFASRVPKAGSAYVYSYISVGEFVAFTVGWNLILEYVIATSSVARGLSGYIDALIDNKMKNFLHEIMPIHVSFLGSYPDIFSFCIAILLSFILASGVKESSVLNNIFTSFNLLTIVTILIAGGIKSDPHNWQIPKEDIPPGVNGGEGGFMPFGVAGVMSGAATCFYGFVGFDCVATTGEEAKNPERNIPLAIVMALIIIFLSYFGVSTVLTMMCPYYLQDPLAPLPHVFQQIGLIEIKWIVTIGAIFALCTNLLGSMFPLPRILYAMSSDGILYKLFRKIHPKTKTPLIATLLSGLFSAFMALLFDLQQLIDMMSIGTLLAYTIVSICILFLRYQHDPLQSVQTEYSTWQISCQIFNSQCTKYPNYVTSAIVKIAVILYFMLAIVFCGLYTLVPLRADNLLLQIILLLIVTGMLLLMLIVARQPSANVKLTFQVPMVPLIPCLSVFINLYLMFQLDYETWIRFFVWVILGYIIYFTYGIRHSNERTLQNKESQARQTTIEMDFHNQHHGTSNGISVVPNDKTNSSKYTITRY